jgi:uncharacterized protein YggE
MPPHRATLTGLLTAIGLSVVAQCATAQTIDKAAGSERRMSVSASASITVEPDLALITTGVVTEADTAREALARNSATMRRLIDGLKGAGIAAKDIQTTSLNVEPRYDQPKDRRPAAIVGYRVMNQVRITARELSRLGDVLDQAVTLGANQMGGIQFGISTAETAKDEARRSAIANAQRRARLYAAAAGVALGEVISIAEDVQTLGPRPPPFARTMAAEAVPIEGGTLTLEASVVVVWALK